MDPDMNKYDLEHVCTAHPRMSKEEWEQAYRDAWASFYSDEHVETVLKRAFVNGLSHEQGQQRADRVRRLVAHRGRASDAVRPGAPQGAHAAPPRHADREPAGVLSVAHLRLPQGRGGVGHARAAPSADAQAHPARSAPRATTSTSRCASTPKARTGRTSSWKSTPTRSRRPMARRSARRRSRRSPPHSAAFRAARRYPGNAVP